MLTNTLPDLHKICVPLWTCVVKSFAAGCVGMNRCLLRTSP